MKKLTAVSIAVGAWVCVYIFLQIKLSALIGIEKFGLEEKEFWLPLIAPTLITLLGENGMKKFYKNCVVAFVSVMLYRIGAILLTPVMGIWGTMLPLFLIVAILVFAGKKLPEWFGGVTFVVFAIAAIVSVPTVEHTLVLALSRIIILFAGVTIFIFVQKGIVKLLSKIK